jgi:hypothetical protein
MGVNMTTPYDLEKALREEIAGLVDIHASLKKRTTALEQKMAEAEIEYNALSKLTGFASVELERKRTVLAGLIKERENAKQQ